MFLLNFNLIRAVLFLCILHRIELDYREDFLKDRSDSIHAPFRSQVDKVWGRKEEKISVPPWYLLKEVTLLRILKKIRLSELSLDSVAWGRKVRGD